MRSWPPAQPRPRCVPTPRAPGPQLPAGLEDRDQSVSLCPVALHNSPCPSQSPFTWGVDMTLPSACSCSGWLPPPRPILTSTHSLTHTHRHREALATHQLDQGRVRLDRPSQGLPLSPLSPSGHVTRGFGGETGPTVCKWEKALLWAFLRPQPRDIRTQHENTLRIRRSPTTGAEWGASLEWGCL